MLSNTPYTGPERRQIKRRTLADRRQDIRFEPGKPDRRIGPGRRDCDHEYWHDAP
ncbi:hypothetical protein KFE80_09610 [bacterium SCSIO 12696]|nr:hypothetical protein KFE80_09610 [bacterium SCSIO 12696]